MARKVVTNANALYVQRVAKLQRQLQDVPARPVRQKTNWKLASDIPAGVPLVDTRRATMARKLDITSLDAGSAYPSEWMDGSVWEVLRAPSIPESGEPTAEQETMAAQEMAQVDEEGTALYDYAVPNAKLRGALNAAAKKRGGKVKSRSVNGGMRIQMLSAGE